MSVKIHDIHVYILVDSSVRVSDNSRHSTKNTFTEIAYNTWPVSTLLVKLATATAIVVVIVLYTDYHK